MMVYKKNVMQGLKDLASRQFQLIAWFDNDQGLSSAFSEDVEAVFMDTGLEAALDAGEVVFQNSLILKYQCPIREKTKRSRFWNSVAGGMLRLAPPHRIITGRTL